MHTKRTVALCMLLAMLLVSVVGSAQEITLRLALREDQQTVDIYRKLSDQFEAENPGIRIEIENMSSTEFNERILVQIAAGVAPDVLYVHYAFFPELSKQNLLYDLGRFIEAENYSFDDFFPPTLEQLDYSNLAIPRETSSAAVFYNQDHFDQAGLAEPASWTYDEMLSMARQLTRDLNGDGTIDQYGIYAPIGWFLRPNIIWSFGGRILNESGTAFALHEPEGVQAMQWVADLVNVHRVASTSWADRFATGRSSIEFVNFWHILGNRANPFAWDAAMLPAGPAGLHIRTATGAHGVLAATRHPEAAWKLVKFLSSTESQIALAQTGTIIPARRSAAIAPEILEGVPANRRVFMDAMQYGRPDNVPLRVNDEITRALAPVWTGEKSAAVALQEVRPVIDQILRELNE